MTYRPYSAIIGSLQPASIKANLMNDTALTILSFSPVRLNTNGNISSVDVSVETDALGIIGISEEMIPPGDSGYVVTQGRVLSVNMFNFGDYVYVSKSGGLTNILPSEGVSGFVAGDWVIRVGVIGKNDAVPTDKDLFINMQIIGQL